MTRALRQLFTVAALLVGLALLALTIRHTDIESVERMSRMLGMALPLVLLPGAVWHLVRTAAWRRCFPAESRLPFWRMFRLRLSAEAFSYLTLSGVTGEPIKVVLLAPTVPPAVSAAATALERVAYLLVTAAILGAAAVIAQFALPLTPEWARVFAWIAGVAAVLTIFPFVLLMRRRRGPGAVPSHRVPAANTRVRRFLFDLAREFRALAVGDRRRLAAVAALEAAAFLMMVLEVFTALWLTGTPVTLIGAFAIETFTRVASMATAFIPANVGALEASNVAAAIAVHAAAGGVALALVRRVRGLAWCAAGLLVYPRGADGAQDAKSPRPLGAQAYRPPVVAQVFGPARRLFAGPGGVQAPDADRTLASIQAGDSDALIGRDLGGMPVAERIARAAVRGGYTRLLVWTQRPAEWRGALSRCGGALEVIATSDPAVWQPEWSDIDPASPITVLAPGVAPSPQLMAAARAVTLDRSDPPAEVPSGPAFAQSGVFRVTAAQLGEPDMLARTLTRLHAVEPSDRDVTDGAAALSLRVATPEELVSAERRLRASIFKPTDGRLGRFNRRMSIPISVMLIRIGRLSAHAMSLFVTCLGLYAGWLFSRGEYTSGVVAASVSLAASVLDGCDGELARLQFKESAFGCWVDTVGDYVYYIAIFTGLTIGAVRQTGSPVFWWCGVALGAGLLLTLALLTLLRWRSTGGRPEQLRTTTKAHFYGTGKRWARLVAKLSTCATRATMPYGIAVLALLNLLPVVVVLATIGANVFWISLASQYRRLVKPGHAPAREVSPARPDLTTRTSPIG